MEKLDTDKQVLLLSRETLGMLFRAYNEWTGLTVKMTDGDEAKLVRGELASILEIPKAKKTTVSDNFPFKLSDDGDGNIAVSSGRVQMPNLLPPIEVGEMTFVKSNGLYVWIKLTLEEPEDPEIPAQYTVSIDSGMSYPTDSAPHTITYEVQGSSPMGTFAPGDYGGIVSVELIDATMPVLYFVLGWVNGDGEIEQWLRGDIIAPWQPFTKVKGGYGTTFA